MPLKISLCDDEPQQISQMKTLLHEWSTSNNIEIETHEYSSAEQVLFDYESNACDLLLLDIEMNGINGMELAKSLRAKGDMLPIVFITGFSEYMSDGYDVEALHYLLKPIKKSCSRCWTDISQNAGLLRSCFSHVRTALYVLRRIRSSIAKPWARKRTCICPMAERSSALLASASLQKNSAAILSHATVPISSICGTFAVSVKQRSPWTTDRSCRCHAGCMRA